MIRLFRIVFAAAVLILAVNVVTASVPHMISYQGKATDASGAAVPDGDYQVRFYLYDHPTAGNAVWGEAFFTVHTTNGLFTHLLGSVVAIPDSVFDNHDSLYLAVMFNYQWQSPRTPLVASPYAFRVNSLEGATGGNVEGGVLLRGNFNISLDPNGSGNGSVVLPTGAIYGREILDEPGIAFATRTDYYSLSTGAGQDILTVTITTPTSGYIYVEAKFQGIAVQGDFQQSMGWVQIDETAGGVMIPPYVTKFGKTQGGTLDFPGYASRVFLKSSGTYTFRLEGAAFDNNGFGATPGVENVILTATFFPTAY